MRILYISSSLFVIRSLVTSGNVKPEIRTNIIGENKPTYNINPINTINLSEFENENGDIPFKIQDNHKALIGAIVSGQKESALNILENNGLDVNLQDTNGYTVLMLAIASDQKEVALKILEKEDVNVNLQEENGVTALIGAISEGQEEIALKILENEDVNVNLQDTNGYTVLMLAIASDQKEVALKILKNKDVNVNIQDTDGYTALIWAIDKGQQGIALKILKNNKLDVNIQNKNGSTALMLAIYEGQEDLALEITENNRLDVNIQNKNGNTALIWAIDKGQQGIALKILEKESVNVNIYDKNGNTALIGAIRNILPETALKILENKDVNVNLQDNDGMTALMWAIVSEQKEVALKILENNDLDINLQDKDGITALHFAHLNEQGKIIAVIKQIQNKNDKSIYFYGVVLALTILISFLKRKNMYMLYYSFQKKSDDDYYALAIKLLNAGDNLQKVKMALDSNYTDDAIKSNNIITLINSFDLNQIDELKKNNSHSNLARVTLLNRHALLSKPILKQQLNTIVLPKIENSNNFLTTQNNLMEFLEIKPDSIKSELQQISKKCNNLKDTANKSLESSYFDNNTYIEVNKKVNEIKDAVNEFGSKQDELSSKTINNCMEKKLDKLKQGFNKCQTLSYQPELWEEMYTGLNDNGEFKITSTNVHQICTEIKLNGLNIKDVTEKLNKLVNEFCKTYKAISSKTLNDTMHLGLNEFIDQFEITKIKNNDDTNNWIKNYNLYDKKIEDLKHMKKLETLTQALLQDDIFLKVLKKAAEPKLKLPALSESVNDDERSIDSNSVDQSENSNEGQGVKLTASNLNNHKNPLISLINYLQDELDILLVDHKPAQTHVSRVSLVSIALTTTQSNKVRQSNCENLFQQIVANWGIGGAEQDIIQLRKRHLGVLLPFLKEKLMDDQLKDEIDNLRRQFHLQKRLTIKNALAHNDFQENIVQMDRDKVVETFKNGFNRLNQEFENQHLSKISLTNDQIKLLSDIFLKYVTKKHHKGSHYSLEGPFILPDSMQILSTELIIDRWIALSAFRDIKTDPLSCKRFAVI